MATSDNNVPQAQITRYEGQHLMKTSMVMPIQLVTLCGHNVYLVMFASIRLIPSSILKSLLHIVKFLVIQNNVIKQRQPRVLLKIFAIFFG